MPTIIPSTPEAAWLSHLHGLPDWEPDLAPTVVLAPHPDDETLGCGGLIARLRRLDVPVIVVALTDGEGAYADAEGLAAMRVREQNAALATLGVGAENICRLHLPDRLLTDNEDRVYESVLNLVAPNSHLLAPWQADFHPDHEAAGRAAARVAAEKGLELTSYLFWTWHRGSPETLKDVSPVSLQLSRWERDTKLRALAEHASQFQHPDGQPILSDELLAPARRSFEVYIR